MTTHTNDFNIDITHSKDMGLAIPSTSVQSEMKSAILLALSDFMSEHNIATGQQIRYLTSQMDELTTVKTTITPDEPNIKGHTRLSFSDPLLCVKLGLTGSDWEKVLGEAVSNSEINKLNTIKASDKLNVVFSQCQKRMYHDLKNMYVLLPDKLNSLLEIDHYKGANIPSQGNLNAVANGQVNIPLYVSNLGSFTPDGMQCIPLKDALPLLSKSCLSISMGREPFPLSFPSIAAPLSDSEALNQFSKQVVDSLHKYASHKLVGEAFDKFIDKSSGGEPEIKNALLDALSNENQKRGGFPPELDVINSTSLVFLKEREHNREPSSATTHNKSSLSRAPKV